MTSPLTGVDALDAQRLQLIANTVPALLAYVDERGHYVWVNEAYRRWFGYPPDSLRGRHVREIVGEVAWSMLEPHVTRAIAGENVSFEAHLGFGPGHARDLSVTFVPDPGASGHARGFVSFATDVSERRSIEQALRESGRILIDSQTAAHVGSWETTLSAGEARGTLRWSDETYRIFGYEPGSVAVDYPLFLSAVHPDDRALLQSAPRLMAESNDRFEAEYRIVRPDGAVRIIHAWTILERDDLGRPTGLRGTCQDITERKRAESDSRLAREQLQVVVDTTPAMIARFDAGVRLVWANRHYATRFGKRPEDLVGMHLRDIVGEQAFAPIEPATARVLAGEEIDIEIEIPYPTVGRRSMHFVVSPTYDAGGAVDGCVAVINDNTQHRQLEHERERALAELKEADRRKDEFLAMLSHELRNPMAPVLTAVEILRDSVDANTSATARAVIERQVLHMKRLLDDLLDVSRVSQGKISLHREVIDLKSVLSQAVEMSRPLLTEKQQRLSVNNASPSSPSTLVHADSARLVQVFGNLLNNAAKYSEPAGAIAVDVSVEGDEVVVKVRDQGIGMAPELLERAFDLFVQDERSLDRAQGGIGIGLTMVRSLVNLHGGSVQAFSDGPGRGCEIVVRLPRTNLRVDDAGSGTGPAPGLPIAPAPRPLHILVVDDNVDAASTLARLLALVGHEVAIAHDGPGALAKATSTRPELVFIDIGLPGMDGYALVTALRGAGFEGATLVAVTGYGRSDDVLRSRERGFDHHLVKPVDLAALRSVIAAHRDT